MKAMIAKSRSVSNLRAKTSIGSDNNLADRTRPPLCRHLLVRVSQLGMRAPGGLRSPVHFGHQRHLVRAPGSCPHSSWNPIATSRCFSISAHLSASVRLGVSEPRPALTERPRPSQPTMGPRTFLPSPVWFL